jgi:hypothetical protein
MQFIKKVIDGFIDFTERFNIIALLLILFVIIVGIGSSSEFKRVKLWAATSFMQVQENKKQINKLEIEIKKQADKPVPPPVIIVKETKVISHEKPFSDPALLNRARKLRAEQKSSNNNR